MFTRSFCRSAAAPLRQGVRTYASQASSGGSNSIYYGAATLIGSAAGAYWYSSSGSASPAAAAPIKLDQPSSSSSSSSSSQEKKAFTGDFISLKLAESEILSHDTKRLKFHLPEDDMTSGLPVTSAVVTKYKGPEMEKAVIRPYTPTSDVDQKGYVEFVIKKYPDGPMSTHIHDLTPGQRLDIKGPIPKYPWEANKHEKIVMIAGGTGITPMYQLARQIMKDPSDKTQVTLVYGSKTEDDILLRQELAEMENTYPRAFRAFYVLDTPPKEWSGGSGHITKELLKTVMPEPQTDNMKVFVCGPPGLYKAVSGGKKSPQDQGELDGILKELGYSKDQVFKF